MAARRRRLVAGAAAAIVAALVAYLALWPVPIEPVAWSPPPPPRDPRFAPAPPLHPVAEGR